MHFSSLPGPYGIGDIGDASKEFLSELTSMRIRTWQVLPTGPTAYGDSPYQPLSAFAGNEMLIGIEPLIRGGVLNRHETSQLTCLNPDRVDYGQLIPAKHALLSTAAGRFSQTANQEVKADYDDFLHHNLEPWLDDYALFRIIKTLHGERPWPEWETGLMRRNPAALERIRNQHAGAIERLKIIQFLFDRQWRMLRQRAAESGIVLFGDIPIYISLDSADAWANPSILKIDDHGQPSHVAGVPPDYFSEDGQLWGNPLYDWDYHAQTQYQWWVQRMAHSERMFDLVRIDHFRGLESFWSIPATQTTARNGQWQPGPADAMLDAMRSATGKLAIVAEDLGVITEAVDALRLRHNIPGMKVLQFAVDDPGFSLASIAEQSVCYTATHDNDTTVGWFNGGPGDTRTGEQLRQTRENALRISGGTAQTIHHDMIRLAFESQARLAIAPMQDFLGSDSSSRLNIPGTTMNNWRWRLQNGQLKPGLRAIIAAMVESSSRA